MNGIIKAFAKNNVFANIVLLVVFTAGGLAVSNMVKEVHPEFALDMVLVSVLYPGADSEEVEEGITRKVEEALQGISGVRKISTSSYEGGMSASIELSDKYDARSMLDQIRSRVDGISDMPADAERPVVTEFIATEPVLYMMMAGDMPERVLKRWTEDMKDEMLLDPAISQVFVEGLREYEISIEVSEEALQRYGLSFADVTAAIRRNCSNVSGGTLKTYGQEISLRTMGRKYTGPEMKDLPVRVLDDGNVLALSDVAEIRDGFVDEDFSCTLNGTPGVMIAVSKTKNEDAIKISDAVHSFIERKRLELPEGTQIDVVFDMTIYLRGRLMLLCKNGLAGLCLVFLLMWLFLDFKLSFWVSMGMPISIAGALAIMWAMGLTLNLITLFGLIMVLGIIVDDAIVVGEAIYCQREKGVPPLRAAVAGVSEVGMPVLASVTTTIVAFMPLLYISGPFGRFIRVMPMVVIACLVVSLLECLLLFPAHLSHMKQSKGNWISRNPVVDRVGRLKRIVNVGLDRFVRRVYVPFLGRTLQWRYVWLCGIVTVFLITIGLVKGGVIRFEMFPSVDGSVLFSQLELAPGTPYETTHAAMQQIEEAIRQVEAETTTSSGKPLVQNILGLTGAHMISDEAGSHLGSLVVVVQPSHERGVSAKDVMVQWEKAVGEIPGVVSLTFQDIEGGPEEAPIEIWLKGRNHDQLVLASDELKAKLGSYEGVYQIRSDNREGREEIKMRLKPEAAALGVTVMDLADQLHSGVYGSEVLKLPRDREDLRVMVRYTQDERETLSLLNDVHVRTANGHQVPLRAVADFEFGRAYSVIHRVDGMRCVQVSAHVDTAAANANEINQDLAAGYMESIEDRFPGVYAEMEGDAEQTSTVMKDLKIGFILALIGIYVLIASMFRSYVQPVVIMFTVPLGIVGALLAHMVMGFSVTLMSMFGMVALAGVIVNDAIVLIEAVNTYLSEGAGFEAALVKAGKRRFRAVFLTTVSTVGGLLPLILEQDLQAQYLIPMALSIAGGEMFGTILTLLIIPNMLFILNDARRGMKWLSTRDAGCPEDVEPAVGRNEEEIDETIDVASAGRGLKAAGAIGTAVLMLCFAGTPGAEAELLPEKLDMMTAINIALRDNPEVAEAQARIDQARASLSLARSGYWPTLSVGGTAGQRRLSNRQQNLTGADEKTDVYGGNARAQLVVFNGFAREYGVSSARRGFQASEYEFDDVQRRLALTVAEAFCQAQNEQENLHIAQADFDFFSRMTREAGVRLELGQGSLSDEMTFQVKQKAAEADVELYAGRYRKALVVLSQVMGVESAQLPGAIALDVVEGPGMRVEASASLWIELALQNRSDLNAMREQLEAGRADVNAARGSMFPIVSVRGDYSGERIGDGGLDDNDFGSEVAVEVSYDLFKGGENLARYKNSKAVHAEQQFRLERMELAVVSQVRQALENVNTAYEQYRLQVDSIDLVRGTRDLVEKEYQAGQGDTSALNSAQRDLSAAEGRLVAATIGIHLAHQQLLAASGVIADDDTADRVANFFINLKDDGSSRL